ncbi:MAG: DMT family transporter [Prolixibacteraceae bacterium]
MIQFHALSDRKKGSLIAFIATILFSNVYIFSKAALNEVSLPKFLFFWFLIAFSINVFISILKGDAKKVKGLKLKEFRVFLLLGLIEIITTSTFYIALKTIPDPSVTSFLGNMFVVFLVLLGVILLKERFTRMESLGVLITIVGAFAVGYKGGSSIKNFFVAGTGIVLINTFTAALSSIIAKKALVKHSPTLINLNRTLFMFVFAFGYFILSGETFYLPASALKNIIIGVILGPILGILLIYTSYKYIEASRSSVFQGLKGVFVVIGTYLYFSTFPNNIQLIGGLASIIGVLIMTLSKAKLLSWNKIRS